MVFDEGEGVTMLSRTATSLGNKNKGNLHILTPDTELLRSGSGQTATTVSYNLCLVFVSRIDCYTGRFRGAMEEEEREGSVTVVHDWLAVFPRLRIAFSTTTIGTLLIVLGCLATVLETSASYCRHLKLRSLNRTLVPTPAPLSGNG